MKRKRFEDILDECISAYLAGDRSIEDSLFLYSQYARELEPLLRAAADTAAALNELKPPSHTEERIRQHILRAASERAAARALTSQISGFGRRRRSALSVWAVALPAVAATTAVALVVGLLAAGGTFDGGSGRERSSVVSVSERPDFAANLTNARRHLDEMQDKARTGGTIAPSEIEALTGATRRLAETTESSPPMADDDQEALESIVEEQLVLLGRLSATARDEDSDEIEIAWSVTISLAAAAGIPLNEPTATVSPGPSASPAASPTATPRVEPTPLHSPTPSPSPGVTPTPSPRPN